MNRSRRRCATRTKATNIVAVFVIEAVFLLVATVTSDSQFGMANALSSVASTTPTRWVVVDFDGTCTVRDTTPLLPRLACLVHSHRQQQQEKDSGSLPTIRELASADLPDRLKRFTELENEYFRRYREVSLETKQHDHLKGYLDRLDAISTEITELVTESGVLKGLGSVSHTELLETMDRHIEEHDSTEGCFLFEKSLRTSLSLHPGCLSVLQTYCSLSSQQESSSSSSYRMGVLSINWCPALIHAVLVHPLRTQSNNTQQSNDNNDDHVPVWSNSVDHHGVVSLPIPGAMAKRKYIKDLQQQQEETNKVVYVGDSSTDLLALIQADVGILFGRSESAIGVALKFRILLRPLSEYHDDNNDNTSTTTSDNPIVWTTSDWDEIGAFLDRY